MTRTTGSRRVQELTERVDGWAENVRASLENWLEIPDSYNRKSLDDDLDTYVDAYRDLQDAVIRGD